MNPQLQQKWNDARTPDRGSSQEGEPILKETLAQNKLVLKHGKPR